MWHPRNNLSLSSCNPVGRHLTVNATFDAWSGLAAGSRECAPDDKLRVSHRYVF